MPNGYVSAEMPLSLAMPAMPTGISKLQTGILSVHYHLSKRVPWLTIQLDEGQLGALRLTRK